MPQFVSPKIEQRIQRQFDSVLRKLDRGWAAGSNTPEWWRESVRDVLMILREFVEREGIVSFDLRLRREGWAFNDKRDSLNFEVPASGYARGYRISIQFPQGKHRAVTYFGACTRIDGDFAQCFRAIGAITESSYEDA